jgi:hypothetical protein
MSLVMLLDSIFDPDPCANFSRIAEWAVRQMYPGGAEGVTVDLPGRSIANRDTVRVCNVQCDQTKILDCYRNKLLRSAGRRTLQS